MKLRFMCFIRIFLRRKTINLRRFRIDIGQFYMKMVDKAIKIGILTNICIVLPTRNIVFHVLCNKHQTIKN